MSQSEETSSQNSRGEKYNDDYLPASVEEEGLIMRRDEDPQGGPMKVVQTNIPHHVEQHSPGGFEFGYGGSGPTDLALNATQIVLTKVAEEKGIELEGEVDLQRGTVSQVVFNNYQDFKQQFVEGCPREGGRVPWEKLQKWGKDVLEKEIG